MSELVGVSEAARRLGLNKGTISKQIAAGVLTNHAAPGEAPLVDMTTIEAERASNLDPTKRRSSKASGAIPGSGEASLVSAKTESAQIEAQRRKLALAKEMDQLLARDEVERAIEDLARKVRQAFERSRASFAHEIAGLDADAVAAKLETREEAIFVGLADELANELGLEPPVSD